MVSLPSVKVSPATLLEAHADREVATRTAAVAAIVLQIALRDIALREFLRLSGKNNPILAYFWVSFWLFYALLPKGKNSLGMLVATR
jgi:hypothetical protein